MLKRFALIWAFTLTAIMLAGGAAIGSIELIQFVLLRFGAGVAFILVLGMIGSYLAFCAFVLTNGGRSQ